MRYSTDTTTRTAIDFLRDPRTKDQPFFLSLSYFAPHNPIQAPEQFIQAPHCQKLHSWKRRTYCGMVGTVNCHISHQHSSQFSKATLCRKVLRRNMFFMRCTIVVLKVSAFQTIHVSFMKTVQPLLSASFGGQYRVNTLLIDLQNLFKSVLCSFSP